MKNKRFVCLCVTVFLMLFMLCGCAFSGSSDSSNSSSTLWILTEKSVADGMNHQITTIADHFSDIYPNVSIKLDILPTDKDTRNTYISNLYHSISEGSGPDIFLLPTSDILTLEYPTKYSYVRVEPFFKDVNAAMRQGIFMDISQFYDADISLNKGTLNAQVMNAGLIGDARYTLPIRYNLPVFYSFDSNISKYNLSSIHLWMKHVIEKQDPLLACGAEYASLQAFSHLIDYEKSTVNLSHTELSEYLSLYQEVQTLIGKEVRHRSCPSIPAYIISDHDQFPIQINTLGQVLNYVAIAKAEGANLAMHPVRTVDGDLVATITYYAAVSSKCDHGELAYNFIRILLTEDYQWEENRLKPEIEQFNGLIESSWPVRSVGAAEQLWENLKQQYSAHYKETDATTKKRQSEILNMSITDADIPILDIEIDIVRYPVYLSQQITTYMAQLNDYSKNNMPTTIDIDKLADDILSDLNRSLQ